MDTVYYTNEQALKAVERKESLFDRFVKYYKENQAMITCGFLMMNGNTNVYPLYKALTK